MCKIHNKVSDQQRVLHFIHYYKHKQEQIIASLLMRVIIIKNVESFLYFEPEKRSEKCCYGLVFLNYLTDSCYILTYIIYFINTKWVKYINFFT